ncbi:hypothetical protein D3C84_378010 [compost metagenome]|jgi:hypothetical protein
MRQLLLSCLTVTITAILVSAAIYAFGSVGSSRVPNAHLNYPITSIDEVFRHF